MDSTHQNDSDVDSVMSQTKCSKEIAIKALEIEKDVSLTVFLAMGFMPFDEEMRKNIDNGSIKHPHQVYLELKSQALREQKGKENRRFYYKDKGITIECDPDFEEYTGDNIWGTLHDDD